MCIFNILLWFILRPRLPAPLASSAVLGGLPVFVFVPPGHLLFTGMSQVEAICRAWWDGPGGGLSGVLMHGPTCSLELPALQSWDHIPALAGMKCKVAMGKAERK